MTDDEVFALLCGREEAAAAALAVDARDALLVAKGGEPFALRTAIGSDVVRFRRAVRAEAAALYAVEPSGTDDTERGEKAGDYVAKAWGDGADGAAAVERVFAATADVAAYEVFDAWNDEAERAIAALVEADAAAEARGRWNTQRDKVVCPDCKKLDRKLSGSDGKFDLPGGARGRPPLHKHCRCFVVAAKKSEGNEEMSMNGKQALELVSREGALALKAIRQTEREVDFVASTDAVDSYGDVVDQASWQLSHYLENPVVLYGHQSRDLPIGKASNVGVRNGRLEATVRFASAEANPMAEQVWKLVQEGILRAVSVGFLPVEGRYEMRGGDEVFVWRSPILKEISVVPVPANPEALAKMKSAFRQKQAGAALRKLSAADTSDPTDITCGWECTSCGEKTRRIPRAAGDESAVFCASKSCVEKNLRASAEYVRDAYAIPGKSGWSLGDAITSAQFNGPPGGGSAATNKSHPAAALPANTNPTSGSATKKETSMDLAEALKIIETKSTEIGTLTAGAKDLEKQLAAVNAEKAAAETQLEGARAKLATLETEKGALVTQNAALVAERDASNAKLAEVEAKSHELEVDALVGVKIGANEKDAFLKLRKVNPELFTDMVAQRADLGLMLGKSITADGNDGKKGAAKAGASATVDAANEVFKA